MVDIRQKLRNVNYCGIVGVALLALGTAALGVYPLVRRGMASERAASELQATLAGFSGLDEELARGQASLQVPRKRLEQSEARLPAGLDASKLNADLNAAAKASGLKVESMPKPEALKTVGEYKALPMTIVGVGDWQKCERFLAALKGMDRLVRLDQVSLEPVNKEDAGTLAENPACRITVRFSTFFLER